MVTGGPSVKPSATAAPTAVDEYLGAFWPDAQTILERVRRVVREGAPEAQEVISHGMPTFGQGGVLVHVASFRSHIGLHPPVPGDSGIEAAAAPYAGAKGSLRFPFDKPIPCELVARIAALRLKKNLEKASVQRTRARS